MVTTAHGVYLPLRLGAARAALLRDEAADPYFWPGLAEQL